MPPVQPRGSSEVLCELPIKDGILCYDGTLRSRKENHWFDEGQYVLKIPFAVMGETMSTWCLKSIRATH